MMVRACPICGLEFVSHCYHARREILSVEMSVDRAIRLIEAKLESLAELTEQCQNQLTRYKILHAHEKIQ